MGSDLLMVVLPIPSDGSSPDWAAARVAVDQLAYDQLSARLLDAVEAERDEIVLVDDEAAMLAAARARLHRRIGELQAAYGDGQGLMHRDLSFLHLFDRRLLVTGGPSSGDAPTELFDVLVELGDAGPVATALAANGTPVPPSAATPSIGVGQKVEVDGYGLYTVTAAHTLAAVSASLPINLRAEVGSVFFLLGHGYWLIELDTDPHDEDGPLVPSLTALSQGD
jgi:hypothetical protein